MKKRFFLGLILFLAILIAMPAFAESEAQYSTTRSFIRLLEEEDLKYTYYEPVVDGDEEITIGFNDSPFEEYKFHFFFNDDEDLVSIRMWYLVTVSAGDTYALKTVNNLNCKYKFAKFVFDQEDNTISLEMDFPIDASNAGEAVFRMMLRANQILLQEDVEVALLSLQ